MNRSRRTFIAGGFALAGTALFLDAFWYERHFIELNDFYIGKASPAGSNIRLLQISDLHLRNMGSKNLSLINQINEIKPDMILFTGDVIDSNENLHLLDNFLSKLDKGILTTAILGNWECWKVHQGELLAIYQKHRCELIVNSCSQYKFGDVSIAISGMDDQLGGKADFSMAMEFYTPSTYHIVMTHCPEHRDVILTQLQPDKPVDLILSGHTHGGQLNIFGFAPIMPPKSGRYISGWYKEQKPPLYVSKGIGTSALPLRLGARAEITQFHFKA